jgi:L-lactate utilization protein LutC
MSAPEAALVTRSAELASPSAETVGTERFRRPASEERLARTISHLESNGFKVVVARSKGEALTAVADLLQSAARVLNYTSATLTETGIEEMILKSGRVRPLRPELVELRAANDREGMRRAGSAPDYAVGSVHAITEQGEVVIASASGSQLAGYAFGAGHVIWVVGSQKIVADLAEAFQRVREHALPLESVRVRQAYGMPQSAVNELLIVNRDTEPGRTTIVLLTESLGF